MTIALCIRCGDYKTGSITMCRNCDYAPSGQTELAYSVVLSDHYFNSETLERIATDIRETGEYPKLPREQEEKFLRAVAQDRNMQTMLGLNAVNNEAAAVKQAMPEEEFAFISQLPLFVFTSVASADGKIDRKEMSAFRDVLCLPVCARAFKSPLFKALVIFGENALTAAGTQNLDPDYAAAVATVIRRRCSEGDFVAFGEDVRSLGVIVAGASGGLFGLGSKISRSEREAIAQLGRVFAPAKRAEQGEGAADFAIVWVDNFKHLFAETFRLEVDGPEIAAYVVSIIDFCLQGNSDPDAYKAVVSSVMQALASRERIDPTVLVGLVRLRAEAYIQLTSNAMYATRTQPGAADSGPEVQMAWEFYFNVAHSDPRGHMIELVTELAPAMMEFAVATEKAVSK